jgi:hypothetical protein
MFAKEDGKVETLDSTRCYIWPVSRYGFSEISNACLIMEDPYSRINWNTVFSVFATKK